MTKKLKKKKNILRKFRCSLQYLKIIYILRRRRALKKLQAAASSFTRDRRVPWQVVITMGKETCPPIFYMDRRAF
jgi:hypothetical protein